MSIPKWLVCGAFLFSVMGCAVRTYPGQPGRVTNQYAKLDLEYLQDVGLFVYEVMYDNRAQGKGVGAIVTKLYPGAKTFTSNARTNSDGTLFRHKGTMDGAVVQVISIPSLGQVYVSPGSEVAMMVDYETSLDEVDESNLAEKSLFASPPPVTVSLMASSALERLKFQWDLLRFGSWSNGRSLNYRVVQLDFDDKSWKLSEPLVIESAFSQNALRSNLGPENSLEADGVAFIEKNFPKGFKGKVMMHLEGQSDTLSLSLGLDTVKTLAARGVNVVMAKSESEMLSVLSRFEKRRER